MPGCAHHHPCPHRQRIHPRSTPRAVARGRVAGAGSSCPGEGGGGHQHEAAGKRGVGCIPARYGVIPRVFSLKIN